MIPFAFPPAQYRAHADEIDGAIRRVLDGSQYVLGEQVDAFERDFAEYIGVSHCIGVANGTDAIHLTLNGLDIGSGDEVVTVSATAVATVAAVVISGATPVAVDIDPATYTLDPGRLAEAIGPKTRAILPVHLFGFPAAMDRILEIADEYDLPVVEDAAQAHGAQLNGSSVGSLGVAGCFSFYPTKNLGALGDGGAVVTNDDALAARLRALREYGWDENRVSQEPGVNSRLDALQAAILQVKLRHLDDDLSRRAKIATTYDHAFAGLSLSLPPQIAGYKPSHHLYVVRTAKRDGLLKHLHALDIGASIHYPVPAHKQPGYASLVRHAGLAETERAAGEFLTLPLYPGLTDNEVEQVISAVRSYFDQSINQQHENQER